MTATAFDLVPTQGRTPESITVRVYPDRAGRRYSAGQVRMSYEDYASLARQLGLEPVPLDKVPSRPDNELAESIAADAAEALKGVSLRQAEAALVDDWNRNFPKPGKTVLWRADEVDDLDPATVAKVTTRSQAFLLGGVAAIWITDFAMPVALSHVTPTMADEDA